MVKRFLAIFILIFMISVAVFTFTKDKINSSKEEVPVEVKDESFDGVIWALPDEEAIAASKNVKTNELAPDFTLESLIGDSITLSDLQGKKVFLNFWATWCPYCVDEMPAMQKIYEKYGDEVVILGLNATGSEKSVDKVKSFVDELGVTFPIVLDKDLDVTYNKYQAFALPTTFFINTKGVVQLNKHVGPMTYEMMEEKLKELE